MFTREKVNKFFKKSFGDNIRDWLEVAKTHKAIWSKNTSRGDMPPTVLVERGGRMLCAIIAPNVDKMEGIKAAHMARVGMCADKLTLLFDAHMKTDPSDESLGDYKPGDFQRMCEEEGAREKNIVSDCILMHRIDEDGEMKFINLPYKIGDGELQWRNDENFSEIEGENFSGFIPDSLRQVMNSPTSLMQDISHLMQRQGGMVEKFSNMDSDQQFYYIYRVVSGILRSQGYTLMDYTGWGYMGDDASQVIDHLTDVSKDDDNVAGFSILKENDKDFVVMFLKDVQNARDYPDSFLGVDIKKVCDTKIACTTFAEIYVPKVPGLVAVSSAPGELKIILYVTDVEAAKGKFPSVWKDYLVELKSVDDAYEDIQNNAERCEAADTLANQFPNK